MAINSNTQWEVRSSGDSANGAGFYNINDGTSVDYSQQDAAQLTLTDGATSGTTVTTFTSATGGFTAAMAGNVLYISAGTNAVVGYYQIVTYTDTNTVVLDRAPDDGVGAVSSASFKVGGATDHPNNIATSVVAYNKVWVKSATYVKQGSNAYIVNVPNGNSRWYGYLSTRGDTPKGDDRPILDGNSDTADCIYDRTNGNHLWFNFRFENATGYGINMYQKGIAIHNCSLSNNVVGVICNSFFCYEGTIDGNSSQGVASQGATLYDSYVNDNAGTGIGVGDRYGFIAVIRCIIANHTGTACYTGSTSSGEGGVTAINSVFYNNTGASTDAIGAFKQISSSKMYNNIFHTTGRYAINNDNAAQDRYTYSKCDHNCFYLSGTANFHYGESDGDDVEADPKFTDPSNGDFTLQSTSPCLGVGITNPGL